MLLSKLTENCDIYGVFSPLYYSVVEFVQIVVHVLLELEHLQDGMPITLFVIHAINSETKDFHVPFVIGLTEPPHTEKWSNVVSVISKYNSLCVYDASSFRFFV